MACIHPMLAVDLYTDKETGKHHIKILPRRYDMSFSSMKEKYGDSLLLLPCGKCIECRKAKAKEWAVRCYLESLYHLDNCFITLTYDDEHCPQFLEKEELQLFLKRLRNRGIKYKYFACGEYGSLSKRPHYHLLIFGWMPNDLKEIGSTEKGNKIYSSEIVSSCWDKGFISVGMLEPSSICYVAQYNAKKINSSLLPKDKREFLVMSRRPGLGYRYISEHLDDICNNEGVLYLGDFGIKNSSRYILNMIKDYEPFTAEIIKKNKLERSKSMAFDVLYNSNCSNLDELMIESLSEGLEAEKNIKRGF